MGGVAQLRARFRGLPVAKMIHKDGGLPEPIEDLREGERIEGEGVTLVPVYTPGHASDHLCYYLVEEKALFTGDVILGGSTTVIPSDDGDLLEYLDSLRRLAQLDLRRIYPAHGPVIEDAPRSEEHTSELQSPCNLVCRLLLEKKKKKEKQQIGR